MMWSRKVRNSKIFFDGVFLSIYSHLLKKLVLSKLCRKKVMGLEKSGKSPYQKRDKFYCSFSVVAS
jgi:hypothetical protein